MNDECRDIRNYLPYARLVILWIVTKNHVKICDREQRNLHCESFDCIHLYSSLSKTGVAQIIGKQIVRSGTSVGAHYREACRSRSPAEFVSKMGGALQELDETDYWLELLIESDILPETRLGDLRKETNELIAIFTTSAKTAKNNK